MPQPSEARAETTLPPEPGNPAAGGDVYQPYIHRAHQALAAQWGIRRQLVRPRPDGAGVTTIAQLLPGVLADLAIDPPEDVLLVAPARVEHKDKGEAHHLGLLRLTTQPVDTPALGRMLQTLLRELLPGERYRLLSAVLPFTRESMALEIAADDWRPLGHCGQLTGTAIAAAGLDAGVYRGLLVELDLGQLHNCHRSRPTLAAG